MQVEFRILWALLGAVMSSSIGVVCGYFLVRTIVYEHGRRSNNYWRKSLVRFLDEFRFQRELDKDFEHGFFRREPQYAIGAGLVTKEEIASLEGGNLAQSQLAFGLLLPFSLFICAIAMRLHPSALALAIVLPFVSLVNTALFLAGTDLRLRHEIAVGALILGKLDKMGGSPTEQRSKP